MIEEEGFNMCAATYAQIKEHFANYNEGKYAELLVQEQLLLVKESSVLFNENLVYRDCGRKYGRGGGVLICVTLEDGTRLRFVAYWSPTMENWLTEGMVDHQSENCGTCQHWAKRPPRKLPFGELSRCICTVHDTQYMLEQVYKQHVLEFQER